VSPEHLSQLILEYRYWILVPLTIIEGPIVAFIAGTLASLGYFNIYALAAIFFARDVIMDGIYYLIGWGARKQAFVRRFLARIRVDDEELERIRKLWVRRPWLTMFLSKISYGIASTFIMIAGMVRMPLRPFFGYGALVTIMQYGGLLLIGYEFGAAFGNVSGFVTNFQYAIAGLSVLGIGYYFLNRFLKRTLRSAEDGG
jgi:membrane-associated protein